MSVSDDLQGAAPVGAGAVFNEAFAILGRQFTPFMTAAVVLAGIPALIGGVGEMMGHASPFFAPVAVAGGIISLAGAVLLQGTLIYATTRDMDGAPVDLTECVTLAGNAWLPLIGLTLLTVVAVLGGMILLIVPGFMIATAWAVSAPALVMEGRGIEDAVSRSLALTRGRRWSVFWVVVLLVVIGTLVNTPWLGHGHKGLFGALILNPLANIAYGLIDGVAITVLYRRLVATTP